jgi:hypothetical protein
MSRTASAWLRKWATLPSASGMPALMMAAASAASSSVNFVGWPLRGASESGCLAASLLANRLASRSGLATSASGGCWQYLGQGLWLGPPAASLPPHASAPCWHSCLCCPSCEHAGGPRTVVRRCKRRACLLHAGTLLTGKGRRPATRITAHQRRQAAVHVTRQYIQHHAPPGITAHSLQEARIWEHSAATRRGRELISSTAQSRSLRSEGFHVQVTSEGKPTSAATGCWTTLYRHRRCSLAPGSVALTLPGFSSLHFS